MARKETTNPEQALDAAQELIYEAFEARTAKTRIAKARKALAISPLCADAHVLLAEHAAPDSDAALAHWRDGVAAGRAALGPEAFVADEGLFWGLMETRPFMRALLGLAVAERNRGATDAAIAHLSEMLTLNPNDNQGARYLLALLLTQTGREAELRALSATYDEDDSTHWLWTLALAEFRWSGDGPQSRTLLAAALEENRHVAAYLLGTKAMPARRPAYYSPGEASEAVCYVGDARPAWVQVPGALDWLRAAVGNTHKR